MTELIVQTGRYGDGMFGDRPEKDLEGVLDDAAAAGYDGVEVMANLIGDPRRLTDACAARGLGIAALHIFWWERDEELVRQALRILRPPRLLISCLPIKTPADVTAVAAELQVVATRTREYGAATLLHNHAPETRELDDGRTPFESLAELLPAGDVDFVIDLHWAAVSRTLLRTVEAIGSRCYYYHFKDGSVADPKNGRSFDLGAGEVDIPAAWQLARARPIAVATVERGYAPDDQLAALRHDAAYVRDLLAQRP